MARTSFGSDFRNFILRGNVVDLAVAVVVGAAFTQVVSSFADDLLMPPIGLLLGNVDFSNLYILLKHGSKSPPPYASLAEAKAAGAVTWNYGVFLTKGVTFLITASAVFMLVRLLTGLYHKAPPPPDSKQCPFCLSTIPAKARKCAHCTSELAA
jgi:large conductance mechanosensitive channel